MSRVGKSPIALPQGAEVALSDERDHRQGPAGHDFAALPTAW